MSHHQKKNTFCNALSEDLVLEVSRAFYLRVVSYFLSLLSTIRKNVLLLQLYILLHPCHSDKHNALFFHCTTGSIMQREISTHEPAGIERGFDRPI